MVVKFIQFKFLHADADEMFLLQIIFALLITRYSL